MSQNKSKSPQIRKSKNTAGRPKLPLFLALGGALVLVIAGLGLWASRKPPTISGPAQTGAPRLQVDQDKIDLGEVKLGQTVKVSFKLNNAGDQPLRFSEAPYIEVVEGC
jgi:HYDIN/CFA65/VesB-like, Ig-like domain